MDDLFPEDLVKIRRYQDHRTKNFRHIYNELKVIADDMEVLAAMSRERRVVIAVHDELE